MSRTISLRRSLVVAMMCASLTAFPVQRAYAASMVEYALLLVAVLLLAAAAPATDLPQGAGVVVDQLQIAAEGARAANIIGDRSGEVSRLSKTIGAAEALTRMTATCANCGDLESTLQQIIGIAALLKTDVVGASASCQPNGVIGPNEQCDPLATPTGCLVGGVTLTYCNDECRCASPQ